MERCKRIKKVVHEDLWIDVREKHLVNNDRKVAIARCSS